MTGVTTSALALLILCSMLFKRFAALAILFPTLLAPAAAATAGTTCGCSLALGRAWCSLARAPRRQVANCRRQLP
eukprot:COSAG02_NODE_5347_length_4413_cov_2.948540_5_plen_75_part_00